MEFAGYRAVRAIRSSFYLCYWCWARANIFLSMLQRRRGDATPCGPRCAAAPAPLYMRGIRSCSAITARPPGAPSAVSAEHPWRKAHIDGPPAAANAAAEGAGDLRNEAAHDTLYHPLRRERWLLTLHTGSWGRRRNRKIVAARFTPDGIVTLEDGSTGRM
eukprot:GHVU01091700.1.p1 GENE.GHVU01091700.1~~GHVU01091700.1.p1  ORF type:complete len:161 (+),score=14.10 GHVU01091700.1:1124-1606(+)